MSDERPQIGSCSDLDEATAAQGARLIERSKS
jgi:hypothetical protein